MKVFFTNRAEKEYFGIRDYISVRWGDKVAEAFDDKIKGFLEILKIFPETGNLEVKEKKIRSFSITKQTRIIYRIRQQKIIIFSFFDVRRNPRKRPL